MLLNIFQIASKIKNQFVRETHRQMAQFSDLQEEIELRITSIALRKSSIYPHISCLVLTEHKPGQQLTRKMIQEVALTSWCHEI